ncbi:MAG: hypothetical protein ABSA71_13860 [Desulfomonilia bacterium]
MVRKTKSPYDDYTARCPMLGHLVSFTYCMAPGSTLPCRKVLDCWHERIDITAYLSEILTPKEIEAITATPKPKVTQLLELIQKAKGNK